MAHIRLGRRLLRLRNWPREGSDSGQTMGASADGRRAAPAECARGDAADWKFMLAAHSHALAWNYQMNQLCDSFRRTARTGGGTCAHVKIENALVKLQMSKRSLSLRRGERILIMGKMRIAVLRLFVRLEAQRRRRRRRNRKENA